MNLKPYPEYKDSGVEWLGDVPLGWVVRKVKTASNLVTAKAVSRQFPVALENIEGWTGRLVETAADLSGEGVGFTKGDILFGKLRPYLAKVWVANRAGEAVGDFHVIRSRATVHSKFLGYVMLTRDFISLVNGSTYGARMPRANWEFIRNIDWSFPSTAGQGIIVDFLDHETAEIDAFIADQNELIGLLNERRRSVLDSITSSISGGHRTRLKHVFTQSVEANRTECEVLSVYRDHGVIPKSSRSDNFNKTPEDVSRYLVVRPGDVVINKMKAWQGSLGVSKYEGIVSPDYEVLKPLTSDLIDGYVHYFLRSPRLVSSYASRSVGIRPFQWRLYWDQLGNIFIRVPEVKEQQEIVRSLDHETAEIDAAIADAKEAIKLSKERRAALISAAVTGKIDVRGEAS